MCIYMYVQIHLQWVHVSTVNARIVAHAQLQKFALRPLNMRVG